MVAELHRNTPVRYAGTPLVSARAVGIFLHGRGGSAADILALAQAMNQNDFAFLAPEAANHSWYPNSFLAPIRQNEPWLSSALENVANLVEMAASAGIPHDRIVLCGFSQGACVATEFVARNPRRYGGLIAFTGGLVGPPDHELARTGDLEGMPAFFGSGDPDPHVPWLRVQQSVDVLESMGAQVTKRRYPGRPHTVSGEEIEAGQGILARVKRSA